METQGHQADTFEILHENQNFVVINKPRGILVHRTKISEDQRFVLQLLRNQLRQRIYPVHRLDRATTGVLVFGKTKTAAGLLSEQVRDQSFSKKYLAIIRGFVDDEGTIDHPLKHSSKPIRQSAISHYTRLDQSEMDFAVNRYPTSRYSLVEITTETGRFHQIRKHFAHFRHPVIGDKRHGDCKHNKYFIEQFDIKGLLLHASELSFVNPFNKEEITITAPLDDTFQAALELLNLSQPAN